MAQWYVLAIQAQRWRKIIDKLHALDVETYYPMRTIWRKQRSGPRKRIDMPLIPSYLFVATNLTERSARSILFIDGIACFLSARGEYSECPSGDIKRMRLAEAQGDYDETTRIIEQLVVGNIVPIVSGALMGHHATIKAINGIHVTASVDMFGKTHDVLFSVDSLSE